MWSRPWRCGGYSSRRRPRESGDITTNVYRYWAAAAAFADTRTCVMGPCFRRDDTELFRVSRREMARGGQPGERVGEFFPIERLDQEAVHSSFKTGIAILHQRVRCQREDRRLAARLAGLKATDPPGGFDAVELRHLDVHQNQIIGSAGGFGCQPRFQRRFAIGGDDGMMP